jgi:hypothetical protein
VPNIRQQIISDLSRAPDESLFALDYDGTLAPIASRPEYGRPARGTLEVLTALASRGATIALVTGREAAALLRVSGLAKVPRLRVFALYGAQRWYEGETDSEPVADEWDQVRSFLSTIIRPSTGLWVEDKGPSLAVHARGVEGPSAALAELRPAIEAFVGPLGLVERSWKSGCQSLIKVEFFTILLEMSVHPLCWWPAMTSVTSPPFVRPDPFVRRQEPCGRWELLQTRLLRWPRALTSAWDLRTN